MNHAGTRDSIPTKHTHSDQLERWLGTEAVAGITKSMKDFYYPIPVHGVPGRVFAMPGGDFCGEIRGGQAASAVDRAVDSLKRYHRQRMAEIAMRRAMSSSDPRVRAAIDNRKHAFANLGALIAAATGGKSQQISFQKVGSASTAVGGAIDLFYVGNLPSAGAAGAAAPGGTAQTSATAGALKYANPTNTNTGHFITGYVTGSVVANTLLLYDRLFSVAKTASSSGTEAVTGVPTRYQSGTATAEDYIGGNFCFPSVSATIANTAHNWTVCQYTDQDSNATQSFPSIAGIAAATNVNIVDLAVTNWFMPMAAGDVGVKALSQMQCSSAVITGSVNFNIGHPIAFFPCPVANMVCIVDGINTAFNMTRVYDNACLAFMEMPKSATTATTYSGLINIVAE